MVAALDMSPLAIADQRDEMVINLYRLGHASGPIGVAFGITGQTVLNILDSWDVPRRAIGSRSAKGLEMPVVPPHLRGMVGLARCGPKRLDVAALPPRKPRIVITAAMQGVTVPAPEPDDDDEPRGRRYVDAEHAVLWCPETAPHKEWFRDAPWKRAGGRG